MQFVSRERRSFIVRNDDRERERDFVGNTPAHRHPLQLPLDGWLHLGENAIWNSAHFPVCRSSSRFRGSLPNVRTRKYLPLIKFTPRNAPLHLSLSHDATPPAIQPLSLLVVASTSTHSSPTSLLSPRLWPSTDFTSPVSEHPVWRRERRRIARTFHLDRSWKFLTYSNNFILREKRLEF